jgi:hypothetical protein
MRLLAFTVASAFLYEVHVQYMVVHTRNTTKRVVFFHFIFLYVYRYALPGTQKVREGGHEQLINLAFAKRDKKQTMIDLRRISIN